MLMYRFFVGLKERTARDGEDGIAEKTQGACAVVCLVICRTQRQKTGALRGEQEQEQDEP